jgi:type II secretory pathway component GspD/PulD (secretin)
MLFGSEESANNRTELFVFISPRILNSAAAGLEG